MGNIKKLSIKKLVKRQEVLEDELLRLNRLLAASTLNLVINNSHIDSIKQELARAAAKSKDPQVKEMIQNVSQTLGKHFREQQVWQQFQEHFDQVHGDFLDRLRENYPDLTTQDQKICAYLRLNLSTKDVAQLMNISVRGVEVARYRLRKRLDLDTKQNLSTFILEF